MGRDGSNACPACYHRVTGTPLAEITQFEHLNHADAVGLDEEALYEYFETYINKGHLVFAYKGAECDCGYTIPPFTIRHPIPEVTP